jgi:glycosyltransferase involved in cell wall biosynthesis
MAANYSGVRAQLRKAIAAHTHLCFTIGGLIGDWPAIAALEAIRQKRNYAAWIDRVEPFVIRNKLSEGASFAKRAAAAALLPMMELYTRSLLRKSIVALLQGRDTFDHYARSAPDAHCTYDTHTHVSDQITSDDLAAKMAKVLSGAALKILYVGRAAAMKGPHDWLATLHLLAKRGVPFQATWIGDGPELNAMQERVAASGLAEHVHLQGFEGDRGAVLSAMRQSDMFLYCHKTPESPRSLIEALVSGCPLVGYASAYLSGLVESHGGGLAVPLGDVHALADRVQALHGDRSWMASLIAAAATSGTLYNEESVYAHRAQLMRGVRREP